MSGKTELFIMLLIGLIIGYALPHSKPDTGLGIYFEGERLVIDGGRQQGYIFNGNAVDISLPEWIEDKLFPDGDWRNVNVRNFHFDYRQCKPNVIVLPSEPNSVIVVEGSLHTKTFIRKDNSMD